jgi:hypothetical protein
MALDWRVFCKETTTGERVAGCFGRGVDQTYLNWIISAWGWTLTVADEDPQTLLFAYPSAYSLESGAPYVRPLVRIECGARCKQHHVRGRKLCQVKLGSDTIVALSEDLHPCIGQDSDSERVQSKHGKLHW